MHNETLNTAIPPSRPTPDIRHDPVAPGAPTPPGGAPDPVDPHAPGEPDPGNVPVDEPMGATDEEVGRSKITGAQGKAGTPAPKSSQGGYGHTSTPGGTTVPQGSGKNQPGETPT